MKISLLLLFIVFVCFESKAQFNRDSLLVDYQESFLEFFTLVGESQTIACDSTYRSNGTFRFTWLPSFDNPVSITIRGNGRDISAIAKFYVDKRSEGLKLVAVDTIQVSWKEWLDFTKIQVKEASLFWFLPENCIHPKLDGALWLLEGSTPEYSNRVYLHSPRENSSIYNVGLFLTSLFGYTELY